MRVKWAPLAVLLLSFGFFALSVKLWMGQATPLESAYLFDYARQQFGIGRIPGITPKNTLPLEWMRDALYDGKDLQHLLLWPLLATGLVAIAGFVIALMLSSGDQNQQGKVIRGPRLISNLQWWLSQIGRKKGVRIERSLWIPENRISHHMQVCGRTGTRKSSLIRNLVDQAIVRGMCCIFIDPKREYWEEYGNPDQDALFDPLDMRCVDWRIGEESIDEMRGISVMDGAYPDEMGKNAFFQDYARSITGYLNGVYHPTCKELAGWLCDKKELIKRVQDTEYAETLSNPDNDLANSIFSTINRFGRILRWMPEGNGHRPFSVRKWGEMGKNRVGHIFLCSDPDTRKALMPLHSMIMDLVLLALQKHGAPGFVVGDEIPILGRVPQLGDAMRLLRSAGCPILLGYQDFPAMADVYGQRQAESIVSNAYTQIVLGQNEPHTAEFSSKLLGLPTEVEREQEMKNAHWWQKHQHQTRILPSMVSAVTGGEIQSLEDGCGFLKQAGRITPLRIKWRPSVKRIESSIPRTVQQPAPMPQKQRSRYAAQAKA